MEVMRILFLLLILTAVEIWSEDFPQALPISEMQLDRLAARVCSALFPIGDERAKCGENFKQTSEASSRDSDAWMTSRKQKSIRVHVPRSDSRQLVVLVPVNNPWAIINFGIVLPTITSIEIETRGQSGLQLWSTTLDRSGRLREWRIGPKIPDWKARPPYQVRILGSFELDAETTVKAVFGWNNSDGTNFTVKNNCHEPGEELDAVTNGSSFTIQGLKLDHECEFSVSDEYSRGTLNYVIPECVQNVCVAERPRGIAVYTEPTDAGYDVTVTWAKPEHPPFSYNISVKANTTHHVTVDGNSTGVTVNNVKGLREFSVAVIAIPRPGLKPVGVRARAIFSPESDQSTSVGVGAVVVICGVLLAGIAAIGGTICLRARRRNESKRRLLVNLDGKLGRGFSADAFGPEPSIVKDQWEVPHDRLQLYEVVGEGAFGVVRKGIMQPGGKEVGVKMLKDCPSVEEIRSFRAEMELMKSVGAHPHVVSLVGCCSRRSRLMIVSEYCSRGDLLNFLRCSLGVMAAKRNAKYYNNNIEFGAEYRDELCKNNAHTDPKFVTNKLYFLQEVCSTELTAVDLLSFCRQIAMGMEFLSSNRVVHRDLAARNVLVTSDRTLKIADFGLSRDVYQENQYKQKGPGKLPVKWMALESLADKIFTSQSDVWSFGVVMWEVVTIGGSPYPGVAPAQLQRLLRSGYRLPQPNNCSKPLYEIMLSCWRERPRDRPTFQELHRQLDALLKCACADDYLSLDVEGDYPPTPKLPRYFGLLARTKRYWSQKAEIYEKPLKTSSNHYSSPPDTLSRTQIV